MQVKLFATENVTAAALAEQANVQAQLPVLFNTLQGESVPAMSIGNQCAKYYGCDFAGHCWKHIHEAEFPVTGISRLNGNKLWQLIEEGVYCQKNIPSDFPLTANQLVQVNANKTGSSPEPDIEGIMEFLNDIEYPVAFLDFETFSSAIPLFDDVRPYQQVPFQFSIHLLEKNGKLTHAAKMIGQFPHP